MRIKTQILSLIVMIGCWSSAQGSVCLELFITKDSPSIVVENPRHLQNKVGRDMLMGEVDGVSVVIKPNAGPAEPEAFFTRVLSELGLGPHYFGEIPLENSGTFRDLLIPEDYGSGALVTEYIPDAVFAKSSNAIYDQRWTSQEIDFILTQLNTAAIVLAERGIYVDDLQILITKDNKISIIDPELFELNSDLQETTENNLVRAKKIADNLRRYLSDSP